MDGLRQLILIVFCHCPKKVHFFYFIKTIPVIILIFKRNTYCSLFKLPYKIVIFHWNLKCLTLNFLITPLKSSNSNEFGLVVLNFNESTCFPNYLLWKHRHTLLFDSFSVFSNFKLKKISRIDVIEFVDNIGWRRRRRKNTQRLMQKCADAKLRKAMNPNECN